MAGRNIRHARPRTPATPVHEELGRALGRWAIADRQLVAQGAAANCRESKPEGLGAAAVEKVDFDLPSVAGKTGAVFRFEKDETFDQTVANFEKAAVLAGPHRYGSKKGLIFVQANSGLSLEEGKKLKAVVDAL